MNDVSNVTAEVSPASGVDEHAGAASDEQEAPRNAGVTRQAFSSRRLRLAKLAGTHSLVFLLALSLFAAADSWSVVTGLGLASLLSVITGALAGVTITTLVHEWFHFAGARYSGAAYEIPAKQGLFLYDWDFSSNSVRQFLLMSIAGTVGGVLAVILLSFAVPADSWGRAALRGGAYASVVYAAVIEWPVIRRTRHSGEPLTELLKIDPPLLSRSFVIASIVGVIITCSLAS
jgi:hypothetical protein